MVLLASNYTDELCELIGNTNIKLGLFDLLDIREQKLKSNPPKKEHFLSLYEESGLREALRKTFLFPYNEHEVITIKYILEEKKMGIEELFDLHMINLSKNVLRELL